LSLDNDTKRLHIYRNEEKEGFSVKLIFKCILFLFFCSNIYVSCNTYKNNNIQFSPEINLFRYIYDRRDNDFFPWHGIYYFPVIKILGWSEDGKIAYLIIERHSLRTPLFVRFIIFDFVDNKIILQNITETTLYEIHSMHELFEYSYNLNNIDNILLEYNIKNIHVEYNQMPIHFNNKIYSIKVEKITNDEIFMKYDDTEYKIVLNYSIIVETDGKEKIVLSKNFEYSDHIEEIYVCGYFISPFENRVLIIVAEKDYTGHERELRYVFIGLHLYSK